MVLLIASPSSHPLVSASLSVVRLLPFYCKLQSNQTVSLHLWFCDCKVILYVLDSCDCHAGTIRRSFSTSSAIATPKETSRRSPVARWVSYFLPPKAFRLHPNPPAAVAESILIRSSSISQQKVLFFNFKWPMYDCGHNESEQGIENQFFKHWARMNLPLYFWYIFSHCILLLINLSCCIFLLLLPQFI